MTQLTQIVAFLTLALPLLLLVGAAASRWSFRWTAATLATSLALISVVGAAGLALAGSVSGAFTPWQDSALLRLAPASLAIALLLAFLSLVIVRYSKDYLRGEPRLGRYLAMLQLTLAAVSVVVLTNHMLVLLTGWVAISLGLHQLLLFYPERPRAALAAHKKFLFARTAESFLLAAVLLLWSHHDTWLISEIVAAYPAADLTLTEQLAALCIAAAALIKCAQLPAHGWLIQVVEAPTPVSALLHAGIINLGGYLLILFAPLFAQASPAQWVVLVVAGLTTVLAALIMTTRISIKVKLAWSTSAQMGLMLVECALGLYDLALLHLLAHACYKAHAFLNAGSAVEADLTRRLAASAGPDRGRWLVAWTVPAAVAMAALWLTGFDGAWSPWLLLAAAASVVLAERDSRSYRETLSAALGLATLLVVAYAVQKLAAGQLIAPVATSAGWLGNAWIALLVLALAGTYLFLRACPDRPLARRLSVWLYAGLYLDEWVTRTTLRVWPIRLPIRLQPKTLSLLTEETAR